jgi:hypothetical protein
MASVPASADWIPSTAIGNKTSAAHRTTYRQANGEIWSISVPAAQAKTGC